MTHDINQLAGSRTGGLSLPGADVSLIPDFLDNETANTYFRVLLENVCWQEQKVFVWGKWHLQPRLTAWYGDPDAEYTYSASALKPAAWIPALTELRVLVERESGAQFNSVLLNLYRSERDRMGWHSDNERQLGPRPVIASLSLGETRDLLLKRRGKGHQGICRLPLAHGCLLIMAGDTQKNWLHAVNSGTAPGGPRINLTFRSVQQVR